MMHKFIGVAALAGYVKAQSVVETFTYNIAQAEDFSPEAILQIHLNDTVLVDEVFNHGCFCSKIYQWNDKNVRGGHVSSDDFDEICKNWFRCRECNDKHIGGSCKDGGYDPHTNSLEYELVQNVMDDGSVMYDCSGNSDACAEDTCIIDVEYIKQMGDYLDALPSSFTSTGLGDGITCPRSTEKVVDRFCNGTAPDLYTTKAGQTATQEAASLLAENDNLDAQVEDTRLEDPGQVCEDGGAAVQYFRTTTTETWSAGKALCESMGLVMATARNSVENTVLSDNQPNSWLGGRRYAESNYNTWIWDDDLAVISPTFWNGGEPNNSGGNEQCLQIYTSSRWNDLNCGRDLMILCENRRC